MKIVFYIFFLIQTLAVYSQSDYQSSSIHSQLPIKKTRTVTFTTDEGSYMNVDLSPDGKTILFDLLGDLYTIPVSGGIAKQLTRGLAIKCNPVWSPDGKYIAYTSDATGSPKLHVRNVSGTIDRDLGDATARIPRWDSQGEFIAVGTYKRTLMYFLGGGQVDFPDSVGFSRKVLDFTVDGKNIYMQKIGKDNKLTIENYKRDGWKKSEMLVMDSASSKFNIRISPDRKWCTYFSRSSNSSKPEFVDLIAYNIATNEARLVCSLRPNYTRERHQYAFSPDSRYIYIGYGGKIHRIEVVSSENEIIPFTANVKVDMGALNYHTFKVPLDFMRINYMRSAHQSPDGRHLVFSALGKIYIKELPKGKQKILVAQPFGQFYPTYSPDGKWIAYVSWSDTNGGHLWRIPSGGGLPEQLTQIPARYHSPNWSPDGSSIVFMKGDLNESKSEYSTKSSQVQTILVTKRQVSVIADSVPFFNSPQYSFEGLSVFYTSSLKSGRQILIERSIAQGLETTVTTQELLPRSDNFGSSRVAIVSPDKRYVVYTKNENIYLIPICFMGNVTMIGDPSITYPVIEFARGGFDPRWEENGRILSWSYCNKYYRIDPSKIVSAAVIHNLGGKDEDLSRQGFIRLYVNPDQITSIDLQVARRVAKSVVVLENARIITMNGNKVINKGTIVVKDGRVINVGPADRISIPKGAQVYDLKGKTVTPGLIDLHAHYQNIDRDIFPQQSWKLMVNLAFGVTTARNPAAGHDEFAYSELIEAGEMLGPRLYSSGRAVRTHYEIGSLREARVVVSNHAADKGTFIKQYGQNTRLQKQWLLLASAEAGMNMTNEVEFNPMETLAMFKDGSSGVEHNPSWGDAYKDVVFFIAGSGTFLTPTLQVDNAGNARNYFLDRYLKLYSTKLSRFYPVGLIETKERETKPVDTSAPLFLKDAKLNAAMLRSGGKIGLGGHGNDQGIGVHFEMWALKMGGMTNMEVLRCATLSGAQALGVQEDLGSIEPGKIADLMILDKNPLDDIHNTTSIRYVMKAGVLFDGDSLDIVWPNASKLPEWRLDERLLKQTK